MVDETSNSAVVLLCGIPASGKSTLSKEIHRYVQKTRGDTIHVIYICYDNFIPRDLNLNNAFAGSQLADKLCEEDIAKEQTNSRSDSNAIESSNYSLWKHYRRILLVAVDRLLNIMKNKNNEFRFNSDDSTSEIEGLPPFHMFWKTFQENLSKEITNCSCFSPNDCRLTDTAHIILVDDNMFYHSMRYEYIQLARKCKSIFVPIFFTISFL
ncbi:hypothetical protein P5673_002559 [Acropora cervicornis]|uniref:Nephrocystin 3-like N-terminal domain-containing protein n=1 Tax=Acropora cervicornis TaxID=6130 RepID=A0AAD9R381_ACRCE|nr:hypothetical protein P5673_002559 [Acropora cervicornis]